MLNNFLYITWNPNPDFIEIGNYSIKWYGLMWGVALISCYFMGRYIYRELNRSDDKLTIAIQYIFLCGLIGARAAHILFYSLDYYIAHPQDIIAVWKGGLASHGGVIGGLMGLYLFCRRNREFGFFWTLDTGLLAVPILAALIRIGNLFNSELYGTETNLPWAFIFQRVDNVPRHPVVLYESIAYFLIQLLMLLLFKKYKESKPGIYLAVFLTLVFSLRFLLEFMKEPDGSLIFGLISKTQALDLPFVLAGIVLSYFVATNKLHYSPNRPEADVEV